MKNISSTAFQICLCVCITMLTVYFNNAWLALWYLLPSILHLAMLQPNEKK